MKCGSIKWYDGNMCHTWFERVTITCDFLFFFLVFSWFHWLCFSSLAYRIWCLILFTVACLVISEFLCLNFRIIWFVLNIILLLLPHSRFSLFCSNFLYVKENKQIKIIHMLYWFRWKTLSKTMRREIDYNSEKFVLPPYTLTSASWNFSASLNFLTFPLLNFFIQIDLLFIRFPS